MKNNNIKRFGQGLVAAVLLALVAFPVSGLAATFLTSQLQVGATGSQVSSLQQFLAEDPTIYPQGLVTGYFGSLTREAVRQFQLRYGIDAVGRVGPITLAKINSLGTLGGGASGDMAAPVMSGIAISNITGTSSAVANNTIYWSTGEMARSKLFYSTAPLTAIEASSNFTEPAISGQVLSNANFGMVHSYAVPNLAANTTYYYIAMSIDARGNVSVSPMGAFTAR